MLKLKEWFKENKAYIFLIFSTVLGVVAAYMGFNRGVQTSDKSKKKAEIDALKIGADNTILKEKLADEKKSINEISSDVDDILDRK